MPASYYDWLSVSDIGMLAMEGESAHMHMGGVTILDAGPLWDEERGLDFEAIERYVSSRLRLIPRYRQRLAWSPVERRPVWIDDARFNIHYHVRHASLPRGATERQLKRLVGRILSQRLDRDKPLWEMWFIEGLDDDRLAMVTKIHHCVVDGMAGMSLMDHLMRPDPEVEVEPPHPWIARNRPGAGKLAAASLLRRPRRIARDSGALLREPGRNLRRIRDAVLGMGQTALANARPASETPLNVEIGPHRRVDWSTMDLDEVKDVKNRLGGTVNDVVLTITAAAVGRFLTGRGVEIEGIDFRAAMPVSTWSPDDDKEDLGNRTSMITVPLPIAKSDPVGRLEAVIEQTQALKSSKMSLGAEALATLGEWTFAGLYSAMLQMAPRLRPFNIVVSNIPGPREASYLLGARQLHIYPAIPLFANQALSIGILSYEKTLHWGFNADWDSIPDLHDLVLAVEKEFERLRAAAAAEKPRPRRKKRATSRGKAHGTRPSHGPG